MKLSRIEIICLIVLILILAWSLRAHSDPLSPILTGVAAMAWPAVIHLEGVIVGGGSGFYDLRALDGKYVWALTQGQRIVVVGWLEQAGRVKAVGYVQLEAT